MVTDPRSWGGPGHSVRAEHHGLDYWAWVPGALPPQFEFDAPLATVLGDAAGALGELAGAGSNLANANILLSPFLRKEAVLSSRIEGTQATIADLYAFEAQLRLPGVADDEDENTRTRRGQPRDVREVLNYVTALNRGIDAIQHYPVSLALLRELHSHLMRGVRGRELTPGEFRDGQNLIGPPGATLTTATYIPPPPVQMRDALQQFEEYARSDDPLLHRLVRLAAIHYQFEAIHPFNDGNGRVGRLLVSLLFVHWGLLPLPLLYLSAYLERNRVEYYERLQGVTERGEWSAWFSFFLQGVAIQAKDATTRAKRLFELRDSLQDRAASARAPGGAVMLAGRLIERPFITIALAQELLDVPYHNARRQVQRLKELGILSQVGTRGHQDMYVAPDVMDAVGDEDSS